MSQTLEEEVNTPNHYRSHPSGIETIEITRWLPCDLGNTWKYCMRYTDKGTPKKDLLKSLWYINDYEKYFINDNSEMIVPVHVPNEIMCLMIDVYNSEEQPTVAGMFKLIIDLINQQGIIDKKTYYDRIANLKDFAESFNV